MQTAEERIEAGGVELALHVAKPGTADSPRRCLVLCHGFPISSSSGSGNLAALADRLAEEANWQVCSFDFRGTGESTGDFSVAGWVQDVVKVTDYLLGNGSSEVWLAGFAEGGAIAICAAAEDDRVQGVAALASPADFSSPAGGLDHLLERATALGMVHTPGYPSDPHAWEAEAVHVRPLELISKLPPRPVLLVHGSEDDVAPVLDARAVSDAAEGHAELRILTGGSHQLRHDPRAIAVLLGWMERQGGGERASYGDGSEAQVGPEDEDGAVAGDDAADPGLE